MSVTERREVEDRVAAAEAEAEPLAMGDTDGYEGTGEQAHGEGTVEQAIAPYNPLMVGEHGVGTGDQVIVLYNSLSNVGEHGEGTGDQTIVPYNPLMVGEHGEGTGELALMVGEHGEGTGELAMVLYNPLMFGEHDDSDVELEWVQENADFLTAMEVDGILQPLLPELVADGHTHCSPGTYDSCLIDGHTLPPGHVAIVIPSKMLNNTDEIPQKHQVPSYLKIHTTLQMYRKASCDGKVKLLLDLFHTWPKLLIGVQHAMLMQNENERAEWRRDLKHAKATERKQSTGSTSSSSGRPSATSTTSSGARQSTSGAASSSEPASSSE